MSRKNILIGLGVAFALIATALVAIALLVDVNQYKPRIESLVKEKTGRTLHIDGALGLSVFPRIALALPKTTLSHPTGEGVALSVQSARIGAAWLPLLRGRFELGRITVEGLNAVIERRADGSTNLDDLLQPKAQAEPDTPAPASKPLQFEVGGITLSDADITFDDKLGGTVLHLAPVNLKTGTLATRSSTSVDLDVSFTNTAPAASGRLQANGKLDLDLNARAYGVQRFEATLKAQINKQPLEVELEAQRLALRPATQGNAFAAEGLNFKLSGPVAGMQVDSSRVVARRLDFDPVLLDFSVQGLEADARGQRGADGFELKARIPKLQANREEASGNAVDVSLQLTGSQSLDARLQLDGLSGRAQSVAASKLALTLAGTFIEHTGASRRVQAQLAGPARASLDAQTFTLPSFSGEFSVEDARLPNKGFKQPLDLHAKLDLKQQTLLAGLRTKFEDAPATVNVDVKELLEATRHIVLQANAERFNLDRFVAWSTTPESAAAPKGPAAAATTAADTPIDWSGLNGLNLEADIAVGQLQAHGAKASNVQLGLRAAGGRLDVRPITAGLYGGSLSAQAAASANNRLAVHASLVNVAIEPLLKDSTGKDLLAGRGTVKMDLRTAGASVNAMRRALNGTAAFALREGAIKGINLGKVIRETRSRLTGEGAANTPANANDKTDFSEISASFQIQDGIANNNDLVGKSPLLRLSGAGQVNVVESSLDYLAQVSVVATAQGQGGRDLADLNGLTVPVRITGPMDALSYNVDYAATARTAVTSKAREQVQEKIQEKLTPQREELRNRLKNLLGR